MGYTGTTWTTANMKIDSYLIGMGMAVSRKMCGEGVSFQKAGCCLDPTTILFSSVLVKRVCRTSGFPGSAARRYLFCPRANFISSGNFFRSRVVIRWESLIQEIHQIDPLASVHRPGREGKDVAQQQLSTQPVPRRTSRVRVVPQDSVKPIEGLVRNDAGRPTYANRPQQPSAPLSGGTARNNASGLRTFCGRTDFVHVQHGSKW